MSGVMLVSYFSVAPQKILNAATTAELQQQAKDLQAQINANRAKAQELTTQADGYEKKLAEIQLQVDQINAQIQLTDVKIAQLQDQLDKTQKELERQKGLLRASMRALYKKQGASTVELLAASDSFSQFIDQQEYLERLKGNIQVSAEQIISLKQQIENQKAQQEQLQEAQKGQREALNAKHEEQRVILEVTRGQAANYTAAAEELRKQQAAINAQLLAVGQIDYTQTTSYPWSRYEPWSFGGCTVDPWGMCVRQCVSYTAWRVAQSGRTMPNWGGVGNANQWDDNARNAGIPVDGNPRAGDVAISNGGFYGHAMYVESVLPSGQIHVSQYNFELQGRYSEMTINVGALVFIHFP